MKSAFNIMNKILATFTETAFMMMFNLKNLGNLVYSGIPKMKTKA